MTTTPLPPFPRPSVFDPGRFGVAYSQAQMVDYATQARADLEAENQRLREALKHVTAHLIAAHSLLKRGGKRAAASDAIFKMMLEDYAKSIEVGRGAMENSK